MGAGRERLRSASRALAVVACALPVACTLLSGADRLEIATDTAAPSDAEDARATDGPGQEPTPGSVRAEAPKPCPSAGHACAPAAPFGWTGPLWLFDGAPGAVPSCPTSMATARVNANRGITPTGHTCTECACSAGVGVGCTVTMTDYSDSACLFGVGKRDLTTACTAVAGSGSFKLTAESKGGSCPPIGGVPVRQPPKWDAAVRACGAPALLADGCASGQVCAPTPTPPFAGRLCVARPSDVACPGPPYVEKLTTAYTDVDDLRVCSKCACGTPTATCGGTLYRYAGAMCLGVPQMVMLPTNACEDIATYPHFKLLTATPLGAATCSPLTVAKPSGTVTEASPVTICCTQ